MYNKPLTSVVAYYRVSTEKQGESGYGLDAQERAVTAQVETRGWRIAETYIDVGSGGTMTKRPDLTRALAAMTEGRAGALVVAKLDRLSRSLVDFAGLMARAQREGWSIVALDIGVDTSTMNGELVASIIMALAQWERRIIGQRTRDALQSVRDKGVTLGRPVTTHEDAEAMIRVMRRAGHGWRRIARALDAADVPTAQGAPVWHASSVQAIHRRTERSA